MVYCAKCRTLNSVDPSFCIKCGTSLKDQMETNAYSRYGHYDKEPQYQRKNAGMSVLIFGIIIIIIGLSLLFPEVSSKIPWWPIILILVGCWLIFVALRKRARFTQSQKKQC